MVKPIDWTSVYAAVEGFHMHQLSAVERRMAVRRLERAMNTSTHHIPGLLTAEMVGRRLGITERHAERICNELPAAFPQPCPVCGNRMWLHLDGIVEDHPDSLMNDCPLSGYNLPNQTEADLTVLSVRWLATWFRTDMHGATKHLTTLPEWKQTQLLIAAIAAVPEVPEDELVAWTTKQHLEVAS